MRLRLSYRAKIFGITVLLMVLTMMVTAVSIHLVDRIETRLALLARSYTPLAAELSEVEATALRQEIAFEKLRLMVEVAHPDLDRHQRLGGDLKGLDGQLDGLIDQSRGRIEATLATEPPPEVIRELASMDVRLQAIQREHREWREHADRIIARDHGSPEDAGAMAIVEGEGAQFAGAVDALREEMSAYTLQAAERAQEDERRLHQLDLGLTALATLLGLGLAAFLSAGLVKPVRALLNGIKEVEGGRLETRIDVITQDELGELTARFNQMVGELGAKARVQELFGRFVDPRIVRDLLHRPELADLGGRRQTMSVMFSDIKGFTRIGEQLSPGDLVRLLNAYLSAMSRPIKAEGGVIDKFIGDAILAYWGEPFVPEGEHALRACRAALAKVRGIEDFQRDLPSLLGMRSRAPQVDLRIGVATGPVIVGAIGSEEARNFTVVGDTVNVGARLESACKIYGTRILIDDATAELVTGKMVLREIDLLQLAGRDEPLRIFELMAECGAATDIQLALREHYEAGLETYRARRWREARMEFEACLELEPEDNPTHAMLNRISTRLGAAPGPEWDGAWRQPSK